MPITESQVQTALRGLVDPNTGKDFVSGRALRNVKVSGEEVALEVELGYPGKSQHEPIRRQVVQALKAAGATNVSVKVSSKVVSHAVQRGVKLVPGIKNIIAVASGKGGVGKRRPRSTSRLRLAAEGAAGVLDADIYGPSQPMMLGIARAPRIKGRKAPRADGGPRAAGHVHRLPDRRRYADGLARADGDAGARAAPERTRSGATSTIWWSISRLAPATSSSRSRRRSR